MGDKEENKTSMQAQIVSQWITSLAISVVCCSVLFIVFAGYVVQLHEAINLLTVRTEMLLSRQTMLERDMAKLRRTPVVTLAPQSVQEPSEPVPPKATSENGMELLEEVKEAVKESVEGAQKAIKDADLILSATGEVSLPIEALNPDVEKALQEQKLDNVVPEIKAPEMKTP